MINLKSLQKREVTFAFLIALVSVCPLLVGAQTDKKKIAFSSVNQVGY